jgi:hypothetical protein
MEGANTQSYEDSIRAQYDAYAQGETQAIEAKTQAAVAAEQQSYEDTVADYQAQYRALTAQGLQATDNQALESRAAGRYGGIGTAQVAAVQQDYQSARQQLSLQQQSLATDTLREMENLRAQGQFDQADALLQIRQMEFSALYEDAVRVDENRYANAQWEESLQREDEALAREQAQAEAQAAQSEKDYLRQLGQTFLTSGVMPSGEMLEAMGLDQATAQQYINILAANR